MKNIVFCGMLMLFLDCANAQIPYGCKLLAAIAEKDECIFENAKRCDKIILVDTFRIFTPECSRKYGTYEIEILNNTPKYDSLKPHLFFVSGIGTGRNDALAIAILHKITNYQVVYYLKIFGNDITICKTTSGYN